MPGSSRPTTTASSPATSRSSSASSTRSSSRTCWNGSTRTCSSSTRTLPTSRSSTCSRCSRTSLPGSLRSPISLGPRRRRSTSSNGPASTRFSSVSRSRRRSALLALGGLLVLAAALRLPGLTYGLPFPLLNPDERSLVPRAWELVHGGGLDPGWYDYPSLLLAVLAPLQLPFDEPSYGAARAVAAAIGLAGVA